VSLNTYLIQALTDAVGQRRRPVKSEAPK
jgi:hypothetical protein